MILDEPAFLEANKKSKIPCKCDFCGGLFERMKHNLERSRKISPVDACTDLKCTQKKREQSNLILFDVTNPFQNEGIKTRIIESNLKNHGVSNPMKNEKIKEKREISYRQTHAIKVIRQKRVAVAKTIKPKQKKVIIDSPPVQTEEDIAAWLNSYGFSFNKDIIADRTINLLDSTKKVAIEYCELNKHELSPEPRLRAYHHDKYKKCLAAGVHLLTIFSDEWLLRQDQCKNFIKSTLSIKEVSVFARKCIINEITPAIGREFIEQYHIQGKNGLGKVFFGIFNGDELLGVMSLGRHHRQVNCLVLDRLCFKDGVQVVGGASRLFSRCVAWAKENGHKSIVSFSDNRWSLGGVYKALGFVLEKEYGPDYSYIDINRPVARISKQSQKKSNCGCPVGMTEHEWALSRGLGRIWDCGKIRWAFDLKH